MKKILGCGCLTILLIIAGSGIFVWRVVSGAMKAKDLGIRVTAQQAQLAQEKTKISVTALPDSTPLSESIRYR